MSEMVAQRLARLAELCEKATPPSWSVPHLSREDTPCQCGHICAAGYAGAVCTVSADNGLKIGEGGNDAPPLEEAKANGELIAALRNAAPWLLGLVRAGDELARAVSRDHPYGEVLAKLVAWDAAVGGVRPLKRGALMFHSKDEGYVVRESECIEAIRKATEELRARIDTLEALVARGCELAEAARATYDCAVPVGYEPEWNQLEAAVKAWDAAVEQSKGDAPAAGGRE